VSAVGAFNADARSVIYVGHIIVSGAPAYGLGAANFGSLLEIVESYTINYYGPGTCINHWYTKGSGAEIIMLSGLTLTVLGNPHYSDCFAVSAVNSDIWVNGVTYAGTATGIKYNASLGGCITGAAALPGSLPGLVTPPGVVA
jgi:hypothetical protein